MAVDWKEAQQKAARTARWAVTMTKVRIRQVVSRTRWQFVTFYGKSGASVVSIRSSPSRGGILVSSHSP
jgi:hypothetical protein